MRFYKPILLILICVCLLWMAERFVFPLTQKTSSSTADRFSTEAPFIAPEDVEKRGVVFEEPAQSGRQASIPLISGGEKTDVPWTSRTPAARRVRRIFPDLSLMPDDPVLKAGDSIRLALFDDAIFDAKISNVTRYPNGAVGMTAHLQGEETGMVYLSTCEAQLRVSVEVPGGDDYYVRYNPETGEHYAIEVDPENTENRECGNLMVPPAAPSNTSGLTQDAQAKQSEIGSGVPTEIYGDAPPGMTQIDVMVVYTPAALSYEGNKANMNANIAGAMQKANEAHGNSDTQIYLNLVHSAEIAYIESGDAGDDLTWLTGTSDGYMDDVHDLRDTFGADFICLFMDTSQVGGIGWLPRDPGGRPDLAFCIARVQQSEWSYTVVHEWGHNMGCGHSETQGFQEGPGLYTYSSGWQWNDTKSSASDGYCSVMTYEVWGGVYRYKRVANFSNPSINYTGNSSNPTGHATNGDNARTIREMKTIYAAYRAPPPTPPVIETAPATLTMAADLTSTDKTDSVSLVISNTGESVLSFLVTDGTQTNTYTWADSNDPGGPVFDWIDISSSYTETIPLKWGEESGMLDIGFPFPFYDNTYTQVQIAAHGGVSFEPGNVYNQNQALPAATNVCPGRFLAPFWADLGDFFSADNYWYRRDSGRLVITYPAISRRTDWGGNPNTFQVILYENGRIVFQYLDMQGAVDEATVGIQSVTSVEGDLVGSSIQVAYDDEFYITNGLAVEFHPPYAWLSYSNASGTVATNASTSIQFVADASTLPTGTYQTVVTVLHNDPTRSAVNIPLIFTVSGSSGTPGDLDGDGLPDWWETLYFSDPTNANPMATASNGVNTVQQAYIAGLDPTVSTDIFLISILCPPSSGSILGWTAISGRVYSVYWTTNLLSGTFIPLQSNLTSGVFTDSLHGAEQESFYRIDVQME